MGVIEIVSLLGGLALFLYGMAVMSSGLEKLSGGKLEKILEKLTNNLLKGVFVGALVTGLIQSSSATTVMVVGFVNSGVMKLGQAIGVIFGANVGTTITSFLLSLGDISGDNILLKLLKPTSLAPIVCTIGIALFITQRVGRKRDISQMLIGFGILFFGMSTMESAVYSLRDSDVFLRVVAAVSNPFIGVTVGAIFTAIIQSSSASVGILQALTSTGAIRFSSAAPIILGQNIGTCITAVLSSIGTSKNAKRAAMIHLYFNLIGTFIFIALLYGLNPLLKFTFWDAVMSRSSIAVFHLIFNLTSTAILLPLNKVIEKLAYFTIKDKPSAFDTEVSLLDERFLQSPSLALDKSYDVVRQMGKIAIDNYRIASELIDSYNTKKADILREQEDILDQHEVRLDSYLIKLTNRSLTSTDSARVSHLLHVNNDFERIGDYTVNILEMVEQMVDEAVSFTPRAKMEANYIISAVDEILELAYKSFESMDLQTAVKVEPLEQIIDMMQEFLKNSHIERLKEGICSIESSMHFVDLITNLERIADHCSNIAVIVIQQASRTRREFDFHSYLKTVHEGKTPEYDSSFKHFHEKYMESLLAHEKAADLMDETAFTPELP